MKTNVILLDASTGRVIITDIDYVTIGDMEQDVDKKCEELDIRLKDCSWMEMTADCEIEYL